MEFATFCYATNFALYFWKRLFSAIGNCSEIFACRAAARTSISALIHSFLFRCVSQPPPPRGTSFHRKEGEPHPRAKAFPAWEGSDARIPLSHTVISSESEKSFSFAVKKKRESIGKRETRYSIRFEITSFHSGIKNPLKQFGDLPCLL